MNWLLLAIGAALAGVIVLGWFDPCDYFYSVCQFVSWR